MWTGQKLSPGPENSKNSKCSVSNQISGEGQIWLVKVLYGLISSIRLPQTELFMIQVENMLFLQFWVQAFQALPNLVRWPPNFSIMILVSSNMTGKLKNYFHQSSILIFSPKILTPRNFIGFSCGTEKSCMKQSKWIDLKK